MRHLLCLAVLLAAAAPRAHAADTAAACVAKVERAEADVMAFKSRTEKTKGLTPAQEQYYAAFIGRWKTKWEAARKDGAVSLQECVPMLREMTADKLAVEATLTSTLAPANLAAACLSEVRKLTQKAAALRAKGGAPSNPDQKEFAARLERLQAHEAAAQKAGATLTDCESVLLEAQDDLSFVEGKTAESPSAGCAARVKKLEAEIVSIHDQAAAGKHLTASDEKQYAAVIAPWKARLDAAQRDGVVTTEECASLTTQLASDKLVVEKMARH